VWSKRGSFARNGAGQAE